MLTILLLLTLVLVGCQGKETEPLTYVIVPAEEGSLSKEQFEPFIDYLSNALGREVELMLVSDYAAVTEAMKFGHADIARFSSSGYVVARDREKLDIEVIAVAIKENTGQPSYKSLIVTLADGGIDNLTGASFAYVDIGSTSGYLAPATYILEEKIELGEIYFAGSHGAVIEAVRNGTVDAGAIADNRYYVALEEGIIAEGEFQILWESDPIFNVPVVTQSSMDPQLKEDLRQALLNAPRDVVEHTGIGEIGFVEATDSDYDQVRKMLEAKELLEK